MEINVKLLVDLQKYSPTGDSGFVMQVDEGATIDTVFHELGIPSQDMKIVIVNGRQAKLQQKLHVHDSLVVFPILEGG